jgi:ubiquinone/menaquinone biosynthesis C-methylase UbiE
LEHSLPLSREQFDTLNLSPADRVLVYPCGDGALCREIAAQVPVGVVIGLDPSDDNVRAARAASRDVDNIMFLCADLSEIPWKAQYFSHAIIPASVSDLSEVERVMAEGGRIIQI